MPKDIDPESVDTAKLTDVICHPHAFDAIERPEGYTEFRCTPAVWSYPGERPVREYLTEFYSQLMGADKHGLAETSEFWSGSDAALRLRDLPKDDLAMRELVALSSRRSTGLNAPGVWMCAREVSPFASAWQSEASDAHFSQVPLDDDEQYNLWSGYGLGESYAEPVIIGYGMRESRRPALGRRGRPRARG